VISYIIRPAGLHDQTLLWCWRNDPVTREMERMPGLVSPEVYAALLRQMLSNDRYRVLIAQTDVNAIAVAVVYANTEGRAEIGICLNPDFRGLKLSCGLLEAFAARAQAELGFSRITATVKMINIPSRRLFASAGYRVDAKTPDIVYFSSDLTGRHEG
jgi:RimJ/RimL family protein N-acetyltransferase